MRINPIQPSGAPLPGALNLGQGSTLSFRGGSPVLDVGADDHIRLIAQGQGARLQVNDGEQILLNPAEYRHLAVRGVVANLELDPGLRVALDGGKQFLEGPPPEGIVSPTPEFPSGRETAAVGEPAHVPGPPGRLPGAPGGGSGLGSLPPTMDGTPVEGPLADRPTGPATAAVAEGGEPITPSLTPSPPRPETKTGIMVAWPWMDKGMAEHRPSPAPVSLRWGEVAHDPAELQGLLDQADHNPELKRLLDQDPTFNILCGFHGMAGVAPDPEAAAVGRDLEKSGIPPDLLREVRAGIQEWSTGGTSLTHTLEMARDPLALTMMTPREKDAVLAAIGRGESGQAGEWAGVNVLASAADPKEFGRLMVFAGDLPEPAPQTAEMIRGLTAFFRPPEPGAAVQPDFPASPVAEGNFPGVTGAGEPGVKGAMSRPEFPDQAMAGPFSPGMTGDVGPAGAGGTARPDGGRIPVPESTIGVFHGDTSRVAKGLLDLGPVDPRAPLDSAQAHVNGVRALIDDRVKAELTFVTRQVDRLWTTGPGITATGLPRPELGAVRTEALTILRDSPTEPLETNTLLAGLVQASGVSPAVFHLTVMAPIRAAAERATAGLEPFLSNGSALYARLSGVPEAGEDETAALRTLESGLDALRNEWQAVAGAAKSLLAPVMPPLTRAIQATGDLLDIGQSVLQHVVPLAAGLLTPLCREGVALRQCLPLGDPPDVSLPSLLQRLESAGAPGLQLLPGSQPVTGPAGTAAAGSGPPVPGMSAASLVEGLEQIHALVTSGASLPPTADLVAALDRIGGPPPAAPGEPTLIRAVRDGLAFAGALGPDGPAVKPAEWAAGPPTPEPALPPGVADLVRQMGEFVNQVRDGRFSEVLSQLADPPRSAAALVPERVMELARQGADFFNDLASGRVERQLSELAAGMLRVASGPGMETLLGATIRTTDLLKGTREFLTGEPAQVPPRAAWRPPVLSDLVTQASRAVEDVETGRLREAFLELAVETEKLLGGSVLERSLELMRPAGSFMAWLRSGDFERVLMRTKERVGEKSVIQNVLEEAVPVTAQAGSFLRMVTSDTVYHVVDQVIRRSDERAPEAAAARADRLAEMPVVGDGVRFFSNLLEGTFLKAITRYGHQLNVLVSMAGGEDLFRSLPGGTAVSDQVAGRMVDHLARDLNDLQTRFAAGQVRVLNNEELATVAESRPFRSGRPATGPMRV